MGSRRPWRGQDLLVLAVFNLAGVALIAVSAIESADQATLAGQVGLVALGVGGVIIAGFGDGLFLLAARSAVGSAAAWLCRPTGSDAGPAESSASAPFGSLVSGRLARELDGDPDRPHLHRVVLGWCALHRDRAAGALAWVTGAGLVAGAWFGLSDVVDPSRQVPWVIGGSFSGLLLLGAAGTAWLAAALLDQWSLLARIATRLEDLHVTNVHDVPRPA